jgi:hypothetical protein
MSSAFSLNSDLCRLLLVLSRIIDQGVTRSLSNTTNIYVIRHCLFLRSFLFRANQALILFIVVLRSGCAMLFYMLGAMLYYMLCALTFSSYLMGNNLFFIMCSNLNCFIGLVLYLVENTMCHNYRNQCVTVFVAMVTGMWRPQPLILSHKSRV